MMTRKHYIALAALIKDLGETLSMPDQAADIAFADYVTDLSDLFAKDNPNFDRARFLTACGL